MGAAHEDSHAAAGLLSRPGMVARFEEDRVCRRAHADVDVEVESKKATQIDKERFWNPGGGWVAVWSPDSKWLAYSKRLPNYLGAIHAYSLDSGKVTQITEWHERRQESGVRSRGKYLYFTASTPLGFRTHRYSRMWESATRPHHTKPVPRRLYTKQILPSCRSLPRATMEKIERRSNETGRTQVTGGVRYNGGGEIGRCCKPDGDKPPSPKIPSILEVRIDFDNISQRILAMPLPPRRYVGLQVGKAGVSVRPIEASRA